MTGSDIWADKKEKPFKISPVSSCILAESLSKKWSHKIQSVWMADSHRRQQPEGHQEQEINFYYVKTIVDLGVCLAQNKPRLP